MALIRAAEIRDAAAIAHVHVQSWITTYNGIVPQVYMAALDEVERVPLWQDWLKCDISVFVAEVDGQIVGFSAGGAIREPLQEYESELYTLYLLKQVQGLGIGKALFRAVTGALVTKGYQSMLVWVLEQKPAVHFYEKLSGQYVMSKRIEISGLELSEFALGWKNLAAEPAKVSRFLGGEHAFRCGYSSATSVKVR